MAEKYNVNHILIYNPKMKEVYIVWGYTALHVCINITLQENIFKV